MKASTISKVMAAFGRKARGVPKHYTQAELKKRGQRIKLVAAQFRARRAEAEGSIPPAVARRRRYWKHAQRQHRKQSAVQ